MHTLAFILAEVNATEAAVIVITGLGVLLGIYARINAAKKELVGEILKTLRMEQTDEESGKTMRIHPQPLLVKMHEEFATRGAFSRHATHTTERFAEQRAETLSQVQALWQANSALRLELEGKVDGAKKELLVAGSQREGRIDDKLTIITGRLGECIGELHAMRKGGRA